MECLTTRIVDGCWLIGEKTITNYDLSNEFGAGSLEKGRLSDWAKGDWAIGRLYDYELQGTNN